MGFDKGEEDVKTLVKALKEKPKFARLCIYTLNCFGNLSNNRKNLDRIRSEGGFRTILDTLNVHPDNPRVTLEGVNPLISACRVPEYAKEIGDEGGVEYCITQLKNSKDKKSSAQVACLLKALCDGHPANIEKLKALGGEEVLRNALSNADESSPEMAASILRVLEVLTQNEDFARKMNLATIEQVMQSLNQFPGERDVVVPAIKIVSNLIKARGDEIIQKLRKMNAVAIISKAMSANSADEEISILGYEALQKLSDKNDMLEAVKTLNDKSIELINQTEVIGLIGNLSALSSNAGVIENTHILEKLAKIIKTHSKLEKLSPRDIKLLINAINTAGKIGGLNDKNSAYFEKNILDNLYKMLCNKALKPEILSAIAVSLTNYAKNEKGHNAILKHSKLPPTLFEKVNLFKTHDNVRSAAVNFGKELGKRPKGMKLLNDLNVIPLMCKFVEDNIKNSKTVINTFDAFISFTANIGEISDENVIKMMDNAMFALKTTPDDIDVCRKALELLQALANTSELARRKLGEYEYASALSKFKNDTENYELKAMIDALKSSLSQVDLKRVIGVEELLRKIEEGAAKIEPGRANEDVLKDTFNYTDNLQESLSDESKLQELRDLDGAKVLSLSLEKFKEASFSSAQDEVMWNIIKMLNLLNSDGRYCDSFVSAGHYDTLRALYSLKSASQPLKSQILESVAILKRNRAENFAKMDLLKKEHDRFREELLYSIQKAIQNTLLLGSFPKDMRGELHSKSEIDVAMNVLQRNVGDQEIAVSALKLLDALNQIDAANRGYFTSKYVDSLCQIVKENADNDILAGAIISMLAKYENDANCVEQIAELKNWYLNRTLETDLEAQKMHLLSQINERMDNASKHAEVKHYLQKMANCYDPKNELVHLEEMPTEADKIAVVLVRTLLSGDFDDEVKMKTIALMKQMIANENIESLFLEMGVIAMLVEKMKAAKNRKERLIYIQSLAPFLMSSNVEIESLVQGEINKLLLGSMELDEKDRMELLEDLLDGASDDRKNLLISSQCLESLLMMFKKQKTAEGKAKVVNIISKMTVSTKAVSKMFMEGEGLLLTMSYLRENMDSAVFVEQMALLSVNLAGNTDSVDSLFKEKVDMLMKNIMFQYTEDQEIFHNAQRTIDLMNLGNLDLSPEQIKMWKVRSRIKHLMTELCRALGIMISTVLTKGEREVRTGDTAQDISQECLRILNEFGVTFDEMIESDSSTLYLTILGKAWLLRSVLMAYTFLVEKDVSARSIVNAPTKIEEVLVSKCNLTSLWDFENKDFTNSNCAVRGGIAHQGVRVILDASVELQTCQEMDLVTKEAYGREYTLEDLIAWVKLDTEEVSFPAEPRRTTRCAASTSSWPG